VHIHAQTRGDGTFAPGPGQQPAAAPVVDRPPPPAAVVNPLANPMLGGMGGLLGNVDFAGGGMDLSAVQNNVSAAK
jgi:hypothetical protein